jgi:4-amino-4-deoxy-L-arabinose transferase-like glycosyltransferase
VTGLVFSFMSGTMHPYYTVALAPGIAALVGIGSTALWARRESLAARGGLALMVAATAAWSFVLLAGSAESFAWLRWVVIGLAVPAVAGLLVGAGRLRRAALVGVVAALLTGLVGSGAYAVATASVAHTGSIPTVGTTSSAMGGGMGVSTNSELTALLTATDDTWSAAVATSQTAASLELATGGAVMSTGGWGGSDSAVTLEQFQADVASGQISYYIGGGQGGGPGGDSDSTSSQIAEWVAANYPATTVGGQTVYDLQS